MSFPIGGVREFAIAMTHALVEGGSPHRFTLYYSDPSRVGTCPEAEEVYLSAPHKFIWDHGVLPARLRGDRPDVVWFPHNVSSLGLGIPTVVTVHDLLYFRMPEFPVREYPWLDTLYMRLFLPRSLSKARWVVTVSDWTARDAQRLLGIPGEKIRTIYHAPGAGFRPLPKEACVETGARYGLARPFLLYVGSFSPRKNIRLLIEAFGRVEADIPHDLCLAGGGSGIETRIDDLVSHYNLGGRIVRLGPVPGEDLAALYNLADAMVFPSLYEGFGLPVLEAFACGCPVVCSRATALGEVAGDAALTFDPRDVETLAGHLKAVGGRPELRKELIQRGFERVKRFSYEDSAGELIKVLEDACYPDQGAQEVS
jgi:glycosyltransferase involved in cell wall biosynthesis